MPVIPAMQMLWQEDYIVRVNSVYILGCSPDWSSERDYFSEEEERERRVKRDQEQQRKSEGKKETARDQRDVRVP